jgi:thioredoxin-dependent peroxiredoxin
VLREYAVAYFMASVDDAATNAEFAHVNAADFPILSDPDKSTARAYGVLGDAGYAARWTFYIDAAGHIAHIDKSVSALTAGADIAARLAALGVPRTAP